MHVTHTQPPPEAAPRRAHALNSVTRPRRVPRTRLRPPVKSAAANPRRHSF